MKYLLVSNIVVGIVFMKKLESGCKLVKYIDFDKKNILILITKYIINLKKLHIIFNMIQN